MLFTVNNKKKIKLVSENATLSTVKVSNREK